MYCDGDVYLLWGPRGRLGAWSPKGNSGMLGSRNHLTNRTEGGGERIEGGREKVSSILYIQRQELGTVTVRIY